MDADSSSLPEVPEDYEVLCTVARDEKNTQKTSEYDTTMDLDVANIDKMRIIHGGPYLRQFMKVTLSVLNYSPKNLSVYVKSIQMSHKTFQLISRRIFKIALEESLYTQVVRICHKIMVQNKYIIK